MAEKANYVVKSVAKEKITKADLRSSDDVFEALNATIDWYLDEAIKRAKANGRGTVRGHDICTEY